MTVKIEIELREGESLRAKLAGAFPDLFGAALPRVTTPAEDAEVAGLPPVPQGPQTMMLDTGPVAPPAPAKRGRPRKDSGPQPEVPAPTFTVRRYGGEIEGEFADSGQAMDALLEMIRLAGDYEALKSLAEHNRTEVLTWPKERQTEIADAYEAAEAQLQAGEPEPAEPDAPPAPDHPVYPGPHFGLDKAPLTKLTPTKADARNGIQALVTAGGKAAFQAATAFFAELGMESITPLPEEDPRHAQIVRWVAPRLGLEVVG